MRNERKNGRQTLLSLLFKSNLVTRDISELNRIILHDYCATDKSLLTIAKENNVSDQIVKIVCMNDFKILMQNMKEYIVTKPIIWPERKASLILLSDFNRTLHQLMLKNIKNYPDLLKKELTYIGIETRVRNALWQSDVKTLGDLLSCTKAELSKFRNMGSVGVKHILSCFKEFNQRLNKEGLKKK